MPVGAAGAVDQIAAACADQQVLAVACQGPVAARAAVHAGRIRRPRPPGRAGAADDPVVAVAGVDAVGAVLPDELVVAARPRTGDRRRPADHGVAVRPTREAIVSARADQHVCAPRRLRRGPWRPPAAAGRDRARPRRRRLPCHPCSSSAPPPPSDPVLPAPAGDPVGPAAAATILSAAAAGADQVALARADDRCRAPPSETTTRPFLPAEPDPVGLRGAHDAGALARAGAAPSASTSCGAPAATGASRQQAAPATSTRAECTP